MSHVTKINSIQFSSQNQGGTIDIISDDYPNVFIIKTSQLVTRHY